MAFHTHLPITQFISPTVFTIKKYCDLRTQIDVLRATEDKLTEYTDSNSEISDEIDQGVISLVDKSEFGTGNYQKLYVQKSGQHQKEFHYSAYTM